MTAKKKPARVPRTTVTGWGVLLLPLHEKDKPLLLSQAWHDGMELPSDLKGGTPMRFCTKLAATNFVKRRWRAHWGKVRIVRITGTYEEAK